MSSIEVSDEMRSDEQNYEEGVDVDTSGVSETPNDKKMKGALQSMMKSMVSSKRFTDQGLHLDIFLNGASIESAEIRFLEVLKFYLSSWMGHKDVRNPYNPIIGEVFSGKWNHRDGSTTQYIAEQISHHPPSSAFCFYNRDKSALFHAYLQPTSKFWGNSFESCMDGKLIFEYPKWGEEYLADSPKIGVKGIVVGALTTEVTGSTVLSCKKTGYTAEIEFRGKGLLRNKFFMLAKVRHPSSKKSLYTLEAKWDGKITILSSKTNTITCPPLDEQDETFSRRVWSSVSANIVADNEEEAQKQKHMVEENQRALAKTREGETHTPKYFVKSDNTWVYSQLAHIRQQLL
eukprot:gene15602-18536_t